MDVRQLVQMLRPPGDPATASRRRQGTIVSIESDSTVTVTIAGSAVAIPNVRYMAHVSPVVGRSVWLATEGRDLRVVGHLAPVTLPAVRIRRTTDQTINDSSATALSFGSSPEITDGTGMYDAAAPSLITIALPGWYALGMCVAFSASTAGNRRVYIQRMSDNAWVAQHSAGGINGTQRMPASTVLPVAAGEQFKAVAYQTSGGALTLLCDTNDDAEKGLGVFTAAYLGPAG